MTHAFYDLPVLSSKDIVTAIGLSQGTVENTIKRLHENHIVREVTGYSRNRIFVLYDYLEIFDDLLVTLEIEYLFYMTILKFLMIK